MTNIKKDGIWVIGDVHGEYDKLVALIEKLPKDANICFCGDLIDRGEKSAQVVEYILDNDWHCVLGNHELLMIKSVSGNEDNFYWKVNGGKTTMKSYDNFSDEVWASHIKYFKLLPYFEYYEIEDHKPLVVSHSYIHHVWIDKDHKYCEYDGVDILWRHMCDDKLFERDKELESGVFNIFGHYPKKEPVITDTYAMIDTGAAYTKDGYGKLSALHYPSLEVVYSE
ncbi:MAG: hypothetical protein COB17_10615 [Sulfurimonas sp.]|nr:MAG: hypothetical protein COB17_10615 [Sulfurimonas sp.]